MRTTNDHFFFVSSSFETLVKVLSCWAILCASGASYAADWPHWRGPTRDGISRETAWVASWDSQPPIAWRRNVGLGFGSFAIVDGRAYVMGNTNRPGEGYYEIVHCLDAATGETLWEHSYPARLVNRLHEGGPSSSPAAHEGKLYTLSKIGQVFCLDAASGKVLWEADLTKLLEMKVPEWGFCSSPLVDGEKVIFQAGATIALDRNTGDVIWTSPAHKPAYTTPAPLEVSGRKLLAVLNSDGLSMIDATDGRELAFYGWETDYDTNATTPIVAGHKVFLSTGYNKGCALLEVGADGSLTEVYRNAERGATMSNHFNNAVLIGGYLYGFDGNSHDARNVELVCMEFDTGEVKWRHKGLGCGSLIAANHKLIVLSDDGRLVIAEASPQAYKPVTEEAQILGGKCWTSPVLSNALLYARNAKGDVVCVDLRAESR